MARSQGSNTVNDSLRELFLKACENGEEAKVNAALVLGVDVNFKSEQRPVPGLMLAIWGNHEGVVDILLSQPKIDINSSDKDNFPLALASSLGRSSVVAKLGKMPTLRGVNGKAFVGSFDNDEIFGRLLSTVSKVANGKSTPLSLATQKGEYIFEFTITLQYEGHLSTVRELLKLPGIDINATDQKGGTPLHAAVWHGIIYLKIFV